MYHVILFDENWFCNENRLLKFWKYENKCFFLYDYKCASENGKKNANRERWKILNTRKWWIYIGKLFRTVSQKPQNDNRIVEKGERPKCCKIQTKPSGSLLYLWVAAVVVLITYGNGRLDTIYKLLLRISIEYTECITIKHGNNENEQKKIIS